MGRTGIREEWRAKILGLLSNVHPLGGIIDLSFDVVKSRNAVGHTSFRRAALLADVFVRNRTSPSKWETMNSSGDGRPTPWDLGCAAHDIVTQHAELITLTSAGLS